MATQTFSVPPFTDALWAPLLCQHSVFVYNLYEVVLPKLSVVAVRTLLLIFWAYLLPHIRPELKRKIS